MLCCCAAIGQDESPIESKRSPRTTDSSSRGFHDESSSDSVAASTSIRLCNEQPLPRQTLNTFPTSAYSAPDVYDQTDNTIEGTRHKNQVSERPPSLRPLDLGSSLLGGLPHHKRQKSSQSHTKRPSISAPYSFRRLDHYDAQRQSLVPLRLGPVVLRESPIPPEINDPTPPKPTLQLDTHTRLASTQNLLDDDQDSRPRSYRAHRESPFQRCQQRSSGMWPLPSTRPSDDTGLASTSIEESVPIRPAISTKSSSSSLRRQTGEIYGSSVTPRSSTERLRPKRKRSQQSLRKHMVENGDPEVDREILELNTIVEERRAEAARDGSVDQHVPAIAPSMQVRARSETLDAIGSALSRPYSARDLREDATSTNVTTSERPPLRRSVSTTSWASSRVSGWLSSVLSSASNNHWQNSEPFYKCQPAPTPLQRTKSEASTWDSVTEVESPSLTAATSPTSKGHSRNHTGESRVTPISPLDLDVYGGFPYVPASTKDADADWPIVMSPTSRVGIAL